MQISLKLIYYIHKKYLMGHIQLPFNKSMSVKSKRKS
jgi:hypothetical protein